MKTIAAPAMAAIEAGDAIVTGAVEIIPRATFSIEYTVVDTIDLDAITNASTTVAGGLIVGIDLPGFDPADFLRFTLPAGQTFEAWQSIDDLPERYRNDFDVILDGDVGQSYRVGEDGITPSSTLHVGGHTTTAAARAAFGVRTLNGASTYTFYINDDPIADNDLGLSILVERGVVGSEPGAADPIRVWGGHGPITIDGEEYLGLGHRGLAQQTAGAIGGIAQGMTLSLSGIDPELLALLDAEEIKGGSGVIRRLIFASDGKTLLDAHVFDRGRADTVDTDEVIGGEASIRIGVESAARGLGRSGARQRSDSDQRLINPSDGYFKNAAYAGEKMLYWGGKRPHRVGGVGGIGSSGGGSSFSPFSS